MEGNKNRNEQGFRITLNWEPLAKGLKARFPQLNETDLRFETGKEEEVINRLQNKLNKRREEVVNIIRREEEVKAL